VSVLNESDGSVAATITGVADPTTNLDLYNPENVAFGPNGNLYIADTYNDRILAYSLS
jgi:sugar lactone lactonase YvrE